VDSWNGLALWQVPMLRAHGPKRPLPTATPRHWKDVVCCAPIGKMRPVGFVGRVAREVLFRAKAWAKLAKVPCAVRVQS
jgi:hypothetical protein